MKLKVIKNKRVVDATNHFTYVIEIFDDSGKLYETQVEKIPPNKYMLPDESKFSLNGVLAQFKWGEQMRLDPLVPTEIPAFDTDNAEIEEVVIE